MEEKEQCLCRLPQVLLPWYARVQRPLPWRQTRDPYKIWISEIMLQQTRVEAVKGYYDRFLKVLPTVQALAEADDDLLHKLWEGLGYYSRVRNLKKAAQQIVTLHGGVFPREYSQVLALPGVGEYTAGAICSIAFDQRTPAVDGNVLRLISRLTDDDTPIDQAGYKRWVQQALRQIYPRQAGDFTQALMELGATLCGPNREPDCGNCPCVDFCLGAKHGRCAQLPVKRPKKQRRQEDMTVLLLRCGDQYALEKRPETGLLAELWQFPNFPGRHDVQAVLRKVEELGLKPKEIIMQVEKTHIFTHVQWDMCGVFVELKETGGDFVWLSARQIEAQAALPTAFRQFWKEWDHV